MGSAKKEARPDCFQCAAFFITYDPSRPYGCRAFGMKSRRLPAMAVFDDSGKHCQLFTAKPLTPKRAKPAPPR